MKKRLALVLTAAVLSLTMLAACSNKDNGDVKESAADTAEQTVSEEETESTTLSPEEQAYYDKIMQPVTSLPQLEGVKEGDTIATIHTNKGDIKVWFFPEYAPKAVENFTTHAKDGYYDGTPFHRVMESFMIQGGDPEGTGMGGESIWGEPFEVEPSFALRHFRGALCMAKSSQPVSIGSQFYIVQNNGLSDDEKSQLEQLKAQADTPFYEDLTVGQTYWPESVIDEYIEHGGTPALDMQYTVFGQVYEGMDVVDAIASVEKKESESGELSVPLEDIHVESIEVGTYGQ